MHLIFDTDMHSDCDDVGALAVLHALADLGETNTLAVVHSAPTPWGPRCAQAINAYYDRPHIPVGTTSWPDYETNPLYEHYRNNYAFILGIGAEYVERVSRAFPKTAAEVHDGVTLYRRTLAEAEDDSVIVCATGMLYALAQLLESGPDAISPLDGPALIAQKVRGMVTMAHGCMPSGQDTFNWRCDPVSAARVLNAWPGPLAVSYEGSNVLTGSTLSRKTPQSNPVRMAYDWWVQGAVKERCSWDQIAALYAVRGSGSLFEEVWGFRLAYDGATGGHEWREDPDSLHVCVRMKADPTHVRDTIEGLMVQPPQSAAGTL